MPFEDALKPHLYEKLASEIISQIDAGTFQPGDRLPSVRQLSQQKELSVSTVLQSYQLLEDRGLIEARPQSGYYIRPQHLRPIVSPEPQASLPTIDPEDVKIDSLLRRILHDMVNPNLVQLGTALPDPDLLPTARLNRILARLARSENIPSNFVGEPEGRI